RLVIKSVDSIMVSFTILMLIFFKSVSHPTLHSFPTRRSSDLSDRRHDLTRLPESLDPGFGQLFGDYDLRLHVGIVVVESREWKPRVSVTLPAHARIPLRRRHGRRGRRRRPIRGRARPSLDHRRHPQRWLRHGHDAAGVPSDVESSGSSHRHRTFPLTDRARTGGGAGRDGEGWSFVEHLPGVTPPRGPGADPAARHLRAP